MCTPDEQEAIAIVSVPCIEFCFCVLFIQQAQLIGFFCNACLTGVETYILLTSVSFPFLLL